MSRNLAPLGIRGAGTSPSGAPRRASASFLALLGLGVLASWIASCTDDSGDQVCMPNTTRECADVGRCRGSQACLADGSGYGPCSCAGPLRQPKADGTLEQVTTPLVGRGCSQDSDCGEGLQCYRADSNSLFGGGPAGGYCSMPCSGDAACNAVDGASQCVGLTGTQSVCLRTCRNQDATTLAENKCLTRSNVVCLSEVALGQADFTGARQPGWCFPQCGSDEDCGGRSCDLQRGLCIDTPRPGKPIGAFCDNRDQCAGGLCIVRDPLTGEQFCSAPCVLGQPVGCGYGPTAPSRDAACLGPRFGGFLSSEGTGDTGFCAELCDVDADCEQAASKGWVCVLSEGARERFGRAGVCDPALVTDAGPDGGDASSPQDASSGGG